MNFFACPLTLLIMSFSLAEIAINCRESIDLFEKYELDYYQNGKQTLEDACKEKKLSFSEIDNELNLLQKQPKNNSLYINMGELGITQLLYYINGEYHSKEETILSHIHTTIQKVLKEKTEKKSFTQLVENIEEIFNDLKKKFIQHCDNEEKILFPYVKKLLEARRCETNLLSHKISLLKTPIRMLENEHKEAAIVLSDIKKWTDNFFIPDNAPETFRTMMRGFKAFEKDFHNHLHIENNILFPKLIALEEELNNKIYI